MNLERLLSKPPKLHGPDGATTDGWRLDDPALLFLDSRVDRGMPMIDTGAGVSTIAFALKWTEHAGVVRDRRVVRRDSSVLRLWRYLVARREILSLAVPSTRCRDYRGSGTTSR